MEHTLKGFIKRGTSDSFDTILLIQEDGFFINLVTRLKEIAENSKGNKLSIRYYIGNKQESLEDLQKGFLIQISGHASIKYEKDEYEYSEYTSGTDYNTIMNIGNHNLYEELRGRENKYLYMIVEFEFAH